MRTQGHWGMSTYFPNWNQFTCLCVHLFWIVVLGCQKQSHSREDPSQLKNVISPVCWVSTGISSQMDVSSHLLTHFLWAHLFLPPVQKHADGDCKLPHGKSSICIPFTTSSTSRHCWAERGSWMHNFRWHGRWEVNTGASLVPHSGPLRGACTFFLFLFGFPPVSLHSPKPCMFWPVQD